jgi:transcriptional regulator GlxA family with amidase domain
VKLNKPWGRFALFLVLAVVAALSACTGTQPAGQSASSEAAVAGGGMDSGGLSLQRFSAGAEIPRDRVLRVGFLVVDGVYNSELMAPYDVFQHTVFHVDPAMEVFTVSQDGEPITTFEGLEIAPHFSFTNAPPIDILVVPSAEHSMDTDLENEELIEWVRKVGGEAYFTLSLCDGAFVLAKADLLDTVVCTTFPTDVDRFVDTFSNLDVRRDVSFVHDGKSLTSQGGAKSYDIAMYLVDHIYGEEVTKGIGQGLIIPWPPQAGTMPALVVREE